MIDEFQELSQKEIDDKLKTWTDFFPTFIVFDTPLTRASVLKSILKLLELTFKNKSNKNSLAKKFIKGWLKPFTRWEGFCCLRLS